MSTLVFLIGLAVAGWAIYLWYDKEYLAATLVATLALGIIFQLN